MGNNTMSTDDLTKRVIENLHEQTGKDPDVHSFAPGRIEVLGNHTDYNEGFVLSAAIEYSICFAAVAREDNTISLTACDLNQQDTFNTHVSTPSSEHKWANTTRGITALLNESSPLHHGFTAVFAGNLPSGSGLASSAAIEMATATALIALYDMDYTTTETARLGQRAEREYAGVNCGLLDQLSSLRGQKDTLVLTDFRDLSSIYASFPNELAFIVCPTHTTHDLSESHYNDRRESCEAASSWFSKHLARSIHTLRDVTMSDWDAHHHAMDPILAKRAIHIISENDRVHQLAMAFSDSNLQKAAELLYDSHVSSQKNFENSSPEQDFVVRLSREISGSHGARLTGGGFGGSVIVLVENTHAETAMAHITQAYHSEYGQECPAFIARPSAGAHLLEC